LFIDIERETSPSLVCLIAINKPDLRYTVLFFISTALFILDRGNFPCRNTMKINTYIFNFHGINFYDQQAKPSSSDPTRFEAKPH
jgi:hypothetical protein